jgi:hypothetical protein
MARPADGQDQEDRDAGSAATLVASRSAPLTFRLIRGRRPILSVSHSGGLDSSSHSRRARGEVGWMPSRLVAGMSAISWFATHASWPTRVRLSPVMAEMSE